MARRKGRSRRFLWLIALVIVIPAIVGGTIYYQYVSGISSAQGNLPGGFFRPGMGQGPMFAGGQEQAQEPGGLVAVAPGGELLPTPPVTGTATELPKNVATQIVGDLNVTITLSPYPPVSFQKGDFDVLLTDTKGQPIADATVTLNLTMPGMWMPPNQPQAQYVGDGKYHASAFYTMRGLWQIEVIITHGGQKQSAFFDVWI